MEYKYYLRRLTFAEYMVKLYHLRPLIQNKDSPLARPPMKEVMPSMIKYKNSNELWIKECSTSLSYQETITGIIEVIRQLFRYQFSNPFQEGRFVVHNSTISVDVRTRKSANQVLKNLILAYIVMAVLLIVYIEYNIFFRRY